MLDICLIDKDNILYVAIDYLDTICLDCHNSKICNEISRKYNIKSKEEKVNFEKANNFVKDVFNAGFKHPYVLRDYAIKMGHAEKQIMGTKKITWVISYENIFKMMQEKIPFYKTTAIYKKRIKDGKEEN